jgi:hypothetical protein
MRVFNQQSMLAQLTRLATRGQSLWPHSRHLRQSCRDALADITDDSEYTRAFDRYEYLRSLLELHYSPQALSPAALGEFITRAGGTSTIPSADEIDDTWPLVTAGAFDPSQARHAHTRLTLQVSTTTLLP